MNCPCCSNELFSQCCLPIIESKKQPLKPEELMRARFSAYATGYAQYILKTYANEKQQELTLTDIEEGIDENTWIKLSIHHASELIHPATVEFSAFYIHKSGLFEMREISRFIKEDEQWRYLNGDIVKHEEISKIKRNDSCPCNSGKKFKKCCSN